jgi:hypothetical protein
MTRAIDGLVNVHLGDQTPPKWMVRVKEDYFKAEAMFQPVELDALYYPPAHEVLRARVDDVSEHRDSGPAASGRRADPHAPDKVLFASDHPVLPMSRCIPEATGLDLPADALDKYLFRNADRFFFNNEAV